MRRAGIVALALSAGCSSSSAATAPTGAAAWAGMWSCTGPSLIGGMEGYNLESFDLVETGTDTLDITPIEEDGGLLEGCTIPFTVSGSVATQTSPGTCEGTPVSMGMLTLTVETITGAGSSYGDAAPSTGQLVCTRY